MFQIIKSPIRLRRYLTESGTFSHGFEPCPMFIINGFCIKGYQYFSFFCVNNHFKKSFGKFNIFVSVTKSLFLCRSIWVPGIVIIISANF